MIETPARPPGSAQDSMAGRPRPLHVVVVTTLGRGGKGGIDRQMDELRAAFSETKYPGLGVAFLATRGPGSILLSPFYLARALLILLMRKLGGRVDVVHINLSVRGSTYRKLVVAKLCRILKIPYVIHLHGSYYHRFWDEAPPGLRRSIVALFSGSARILVLGEVWRKRVSERAPRTAGRIEIFPTSTSDPGVLAPHNGDRVEILFAGRHGERKGVLQLVSALARLAEDRSWHATLAGDGAFEETRTSASELGIGDRVTIPGWLGATEMEALMRKADILALPSFDENLPLSVVEAFADGVAVISTPVGAIPEIVTNDETGLLVAPGDVDGLADALRRLVHDRELRRRLARNARRVFESRLELAGYADRLVATWRQVAAFAPPDVV